MPEVATSARACRKCGALILPQGVEGFCGACLLETGLGPLIDDEAVGTAPVLIDFGEYELLEEIGRGGQGVVYRARQKGLNRIVALKVIALGHWATETHLRRFRTEAEAAAQLDYPGIVPIYDIGERDGACYFSMKLIEGGQLDELVRHKPLSIREAAQLIVKVARTLHYAHEHGVLHRDVKPGNILLDAEGEPHLTDFGLARLVEKESNVTRTMDVLGTPSYMAPEQATGGNEELTSATDVYGLGAVFYHLLTGQPPFAAGTTYKTIRMVMEDEPRLPRLLNPKVDRDISTISLKCLEKNPQRRYDSALSLAEDLERWLKHEPIRARKTGLAMRSLKWVRRNPTLAAALPLFVASAITISLMWWKQRAEAAPPMGIAVLPFENLSSDKDNAFFADGLQDDILTKLAKVADLKVISRTSVMGYRGERNTRKIGNALHVSHVLEGSVHKIDGHIRVNAQLIDTHNDTHIWAETYDRDRSELFAIEAELAEQVAGRLRANVSGSEKSAIEARPTRDLEAYDLYLRGKQLIANLSLMDPDPLAKPKAATELLEKAVVRDPGFALAWCVLAEANLILYWTPDKPPEYLTKAEAAVQRARQLAPNAGETHFVQALLSYRKLDFDHALEELEITARLLPNSAEVFQLSSWVERRMGRWHETLRHGTRAAELDPRNFSVREDLLRDHLCVRRNAEIVRLADQAIADFPDKADHFRVQKADALLNEADLPAARASLESMSSKWPVSVDSFLSWFSLLLYERNYGEAERIIASRTDLTLRQYLVPDVCFNGFIARAQDDAERTTETFKACHEQLETKLQEHPDEGVWISTAALADAALGRREAAIEEVMRAWELTDVLERSLISLDRANVYCWLGEKDHAFEELEKVVKSSIGEIYGDLRFNPCWDSLRDDPRFEKILEAAAKPLL